MNDAMNELTILFVVLATLTIAYLWIYPTFVGNNVRRMAIYDVAIGAVPLAIAGALYWGEPSHFTLLFFDTNWFIFTLGLYVILEIPLFFWYVSARGLGAEMKALWGLGPNGSLEPFGTASEAQVEKQLQDTRWNGLRTPKALRRLVIVSNLVFWAGTIFLLTVGDTVWSTLALIHVLLLFVFLLLLRKAVRLVADAPVTALDERLVQLRDRSYVEAYRWLTALMFVIGAAALGWAISNDIRNIGDEFAYPATITWPQVQALFWFCLFYPAALPSMAMAWAQARLESKSHA